MTNRSLHRLERAKACGADTSVEASSLSLGFFEGQELTEPRLVGDLLKRGEQPIETELAEPIFDSRVLSVIRFHCVEPSGVGRTKRGRGHAPRRGRHADWS